MIETILGVLTSGGFGAITGLVGGFLAKREQRKLLELQNSHDLQMAEIDFKQSELEHKQALALVDKQVEIAQVEGAIQQDIKDAEAFIESQKSLTQPASHPFMEIGKSLIRPVLTIILLFVTWDIYTDLHEIVGGLEGLDSDHTQDLFIYVVHSIIFLTITAVSWWFASRGEKAVAAIKGMIKP